MKDKMSGTAKDGISGTAARQGVRKGVAMPVLVISTVSAFILLALIYFVFWPWPEPDMHPVSQPATDQSTPVVPPAAPNTDTGKPATTPQ